MKIKFSLIFLLLSVILTLPIILGLVHAGFPLTDDGNWMIIRFSAFYESLKSGQFPVRFLMRLNNGYGYPVADFLYPLFMYLATPIKALGFGFVESIKILLILCIVSSSVFCYLWLRRLFDNISSLTGAFVYSYFPYHMYDLYKRGSVGEILALTIIPFVLYQIERKSIIHASVGIALLVMSHNSLAVLFLAIILAYGLLEAYITKDKKAILKFYSSSLLLGLGMSAFFWIPAIIDLKYTLFRSVIVSDWKSYFTDYNLIGLSTFVVIASFLSLTLVKKIDFKKHRLTLVFLAIGVVSIFLSTGYSEFVWNLAPVSFIQFPFRFLSISAICVAFLSAVVAYTFKEEKTKIMTAVLIMIVAFVSSIPYLTANNYQEYPDSFYSTNQDTTTVKNEYMPKWVKEVPTAMYESKVENINGSEKTTALSLLPNKTSFNIDLSQRRIVRVNTIYFPGWHAYSNGQEIGISYDNPKGVMDINLEKGQNAVEVVFKETSERSFANIVSIISLLLLGAVYLLTLNKRYNLFK